MQSTFLLVGSPVLRIILFCDLRRPALLAAISSLFIPVHSPSEVYESPTVENMAEVR